MRVKQRGWRTRREFTEKASVFLNPKTEVEPQIAQIDTDFEEVVETVLKIVWWNHNP
jgi:hypothetical protein